MKVYVVLGTLSDHDGTYIAGVYTSKKEADQRFELTLKPAWVEDHLLIGDTE